MHLKENYPNLTQSLKETETIFLNLNSVQSNVTPLNMKPLMDMNQYFELHIINFLTELAVFTNFNMFLLA